MHVYKNTFLVEVLVRLRRLYQKNSYAKRRIDYVQSNNEKNREICLT